MADSTRPSEEDNELSSRKERKAAYNRAYHAQNRDKILARQRAYRHANREKMRAASREWNRKNKARVRQTTKAWEEANKDRVRELNRRFHEQNKDSIRLRKMQWRKDNASHVSQKKREWRKANRDRVRKTANAWYSKRCKEDPAFHLSCRLRGRILEVLGRSLVRKHSRTVSLLGCTGSELKEWIESKFSEGMSWENRSEWHIDHVIPVSKFDLRDPAQQSAAFHYTNLQPLWAKDNLRKSNKVEGQNLFGFAYAARIADKASATPKKRRKRGG